MKVGIRQKVLLETLTKGSAAAISEDAQADTSNLSLLIKSITITADKHLTIESNTDLLAVKYGVLVNKDSGIVVKEEGSVVVPAKELIDWVKLQNDDSTITMSLQKLQTPELIDTLSDISESDSENYDKTKFSIKKIGILKITSKDTSNTLTKWETDCFDSENKSSINFSEKSDKNFEISGEKFLDTLNNVKFAAKPKDYEHVLDSISMQVYDKELYFAATDMQHCAIYKIPSDVEIQSDRPLLVPVGLLDYVAKIINKDEKISVSYNEEKERVYIGQTNLKIRVASTEKKHISKFPSIELLMKKVYKPLTECSRSSMMGLLANASFINSSSALFVFLKENGTLTVKAVSEDAKKRPNIRQCNVADISKDTRGIWGVTHMLDCLKVIKASDIQLHLPDNMKSLKITAKDDKNFVYYTMSVENSLYNE